MKNSLFTVITPTFNCREVFERCIKSIDQQLYPNIEHIIVDGGSTDGTLDVAMSNRSLNVRVISQPDRGIYDAMNKGLICSKGKYVHILNADDYYNDETVLSTIAEYLHQYDVVVGDVDYFGADDVGFATRHWVTGPFPVDGFQGGWHPCHPGFFCRRSMFEKFGGFDTKYDIAADYDLMHRFCRDQTSILILERVTTWMQNDGLSSSLYNRLRGNVQCWRSFNSVVEKKISLFNFLINRYRYKKDQ